MNANYKRNKHLAQGFAFLLCALIAAIVVGKLNSRPTITLTADKEKTVLRIQDQEYALGTKPVKIVLPNGVHRYQAVQGEFAITGLVNTEDSRHTTVDLEFSRLEIASIHKDVCGERPENGALFCQKTPSALTAKLIDNNSWALITDSTGYSEAVQQTNDGWRFVQISQSDVYGGQYPKGLEKAAREYE